MAANRAQRLQRLSSCLRLDATSAMNYAQA
jgi:hypothetical protein